MTDLSNAANNRAEMAEIKRRYMLGEINRKEALRQAEPILRRVNEQSLVIARKWGKKNYPKKTFTDAMRDSY